MARSRISRRGILALGLVGTLTVVTAQTPAPTQQPGVVTEIDPGTFNAQLTSHLDQQLKLVTGRNGTGAFTLPEGKLEWTYTFLTTATPMTVSDPTVQGLILVRDAYAAQLRGFADSVEQVANASVTERVDIARHLQPAAQTLERLRREEIQLADSDRLTNPKVRPGDPGRTTEWGSRARYDSLMRQADQAEAAGSPDRAKGLRADAAATNWGQRMRLQQQAAEIVRQNPLLGLQVNDRFLWQDLHALDLDGDPTSGSRLVRLFATDNVPILRDEATRTQGITSLPDLLPFGSPQFAAQQQALEQWGQSMNTPLVGQFVNDARGLGKVIQLNDRFWGIGSDALRGVVVAGTQLFGIGPAVAGINGGYQIFSDGHDMYVAYGELDRAEQFAAVTGLERVQAAEQAAGSATNTFITGLPMNMFDIGAWGAGRIYRVRIAPAEAARAARRAEFETWVVPKAMLKRIDPDVRVKLVADETPAAFFERTGLLPEHTVNAGGRTWHLSKPFKMEVPNWSHLSPEQLERARSQARTAVVAFEEGPLGTLIPHVFYISNSHGWWKAFPFTNGRGWLGKGPLRDGLEGRKAVNEGAVDLAAELQGPVARWVEGNPLTPLAPDDAVQAGYGFVDELSPPRDPASLNRAKYLALYAQPSDVMRPLPTNAMYPDFARGPLDRWEFNSPIYGRTEGFLYASEGGDTLFVVFRDERGNVWNQIQDARANVTPYGNRQTVFDAGGLDETPVEYLRQGGVPTDWIPSAFAETYGIRTDYKNPLNTIFAERLPPRPPAGGGTPRAAEVADAPPAAAPATGPGRPPSGASVIPTLRGAGEGPADAASGSARPPSFIPPQSMMSDAEFKAALAAKGLPTDPQALREALDSVPEELREESWYAVDEVARARAAAPPVESDDNDAPAGNGSLLVRPNGVVSVTPSDQQRALPGLLDSNGGILLFPPGTIVDPNAPLPPIFQSLPTPFRAGSGFRQPDGSILYPGLEVRGLGGAPEPNGSGPTSDAMLITPVDPARSPTGAASAGGGADTSRVNAIGGAGSTGIPPGPLSVLTDLETFKGKPTFADPGTTPTTMVAAPPLNLSDPVYSGGPFYGMNNLCCDDDVQNLVIRVRMTLPSSARQEPPVLSLAARSVAEFLMRPFAPARLHASVASATPSRRRFEPGRRAGQNTTGSTAGRAFAVITSLGSSQGEAFSLQMVQDGATARQVIGDVVVEPIRRAAMNEAQRQLQKLVGDRLKNAVSARVEGYCLDFALAPPSTGMLFRIAPPDVQNRYKAVGPLLEAADRLASEGQLHPDTEPKAYFESIKQWVTWTRLENWDQKRFTSAWLDRTKRTAAALKRTFTPTMEQAIVKAAPGRWRDIQLITQAGG